jgi:hypothetical protein
MNLAALNASNGNGESIRATVQSNRSIGSTALTVNATTNWPSGTFIATTGTLQANGTLNPVTVQVFYGTASGTAITITSYASGYTDQGSAIGDVVVLKPTTEWANIVAQGVQGVTQFPDNFNNFVESTGGVWTQTSGLVGAMTAGYIWYNGTRTAIAVITAYTFTASKDTYTDFNGTTGAVTYVAVTNGAAEPAVTSGCVRTAKVVTNGSGITSVSQVGYQTLVKSTQLSNPYKFSAYVSAGSQTGATFPVVFQTKILDTGGNYNNSTGVFTAPISGFYQFNAALCLPQSASSGYSTDLYKNSAPYNAPTFRGQAVVPSYTGASVVTTISVSAQLVAGDTMTVGSSYANGGTIIYAPTASNYFQGFLISAS